MGAACCLSAVGRGGLKGLDPFKGQRGDAWIRGVRAACGTGHALRGAPPPPRPACEAQVKGRETELIRPQGVFYYGSRTFLATSVLCLGEDEFSK